MRYVLHVASRAVPGREEDYDRWYDQFHAVEMCRISGVESCSRHRELDMEGAETGVFIANYEVEIDDPAALLQSVFAAAPTMNLTNSIVMTSPRFIFHKPSKAQRT